MKKKLILLGIHLTVVALVLILTMVTLAWYTKNETVTTSNTIITAEPIDNLGITEIVENIVHYKGETGLGGELDAPYIATKIVSIEAYTAICVRKGWKERKNMLPLSCFF